MSENLKRDNWTNAEVIALIEGLKFFHQEEDGHWAESDLTARHNVTVQEVADYFREHFACPNDDFSALALDTKTGEVFHVGVMLPNES